MIKSENGHTEIKGTILDLIADICAVTRAVFSSVKKDSPVFAVFTAHSFVKTIQDVVQSVLTGEDLNDIAKRKRQQIAEKTGRTEEEVSNLISKFTADTNDSPDSVDASADAFVMMGFAGETVDSMFDRLLKKNGGENNDSEDQHS